MKYLSLALLALGLGACGQFDVTLSRVCNTEQSAHAFYTTFVAPFRPAAAVANEAKFYARVQNLCVLGAPESTIVVAAQASATARQQ